MGTQPSSSILKLAFAFLVVLGLSLVHPESARALSFNNWSSAGPTPTKTTIKTVLATSSKVYAGGDGGGVYTWPVSGGATWSESNSGLTNRQIQTLAANPTDNTILFAGTKNGIFKSTNSGTAWVATNSGLTTANQLDIRAIAINTATPSTMYVATAAGVFKSINSGASWSATGALSSDVRSIAIKPLNPTTLFAATDNGVYVSSTSGGTWVNTTNNLGNTDVRSLIMYSTALDTIYAATAGGVYRTDDSGASWVTTGPLSPALAPLEILSLTFGSTPAILFAGTNGSGLYVSSDSGATWGSLVSLPGPTVVYGLSTLSGGTLYAGTDYGVYRSANSGGAWAKLNTGLLQGRSIAIQAADASLLVTGFSGGGIFRYYENSWVQPSTETSNPFITSILFDPYSAGVVYAGSGAGVFRSDNNGNTWSDITGNLGVPDVHSLAIDPTAPHYLFAGTSSGVFSWNGTTWSPYPALLEKKVLSLIFKESSLIAGTNGSNIYRSDSRGSWSSQPDIGIGLGGEIINTLALYSGTLYAGTNAGVHKSTDTGTNWSAINTGITNLNILSLAVNQSTYDPLSTPPKTITTLAAGTAGGGVFISNNDGVRWSAINTKLTDRTVNSIAADNIWPQHLHAATSTKVFSLKMSPVIQVLPATGTNFGSANILSVSTRTYTITNNGLISLSISDITEGSISPFGTVTSLTPGTCSDGTNFTSIPKTATPASILTITPGSSCTFNFSFTPSDTGSGTATLTFTSNDVSSPSSAVTLLWTGVDPRPTSAITSPVAASTIQTPTTITGTASDVGSGLATVEFSTDGGTTWTVATGTDTWSSPSAWNPGADGTYIIKSRATDLNGNTQLTPASVTINVDNADPSSAISSPLDTAVVKGTAITLSGTAADPTSPGSGVILVEISTDGGTSWLPATGTTTWTFPWTLPADNLYTLQARATDNAGNQGTSTTVTVRVDNTSPAVSITAPTSGLTLPVGTTYTITGTSSDAGSGVNLVEVSLDNGTTWQLATGTSTWSYIWTLPINGPYTIKARATDLAGNVGTSTSISITINNPRPTSAITSPVASSFVNGITLTVAGTAAPGDASLGLSAVQVSIDGGATWLAANGTSTWTRSVPLPQSTGLSGSTSGYVPAFTILSRAVDGIGNLQILTTDVLISVDNELPTSAITSPVTGAYIRGITATIQGTAADTGFGVNHVDLSMDGGATFPITATGTTLWSYSWTLPADGTYVIVSRATDSNVANLQSPWTTITVTVDNTAPVTTIDAAPPDPSNSPRPVFRFSANEIATFNCSIDNAAYAPCTTPFTLPTLAEGSHTFRVYAVDLAGNIGAAAPTHTWIVDLTPPTVTSVTPVNGSTRISVSLSQITSTFAKPLNPATVTTSSFSLNNGATGTVSYNSTTYTAVFTPSAPLRYSTVYTATLSTSIADPAGNTMATAYTWTFTTDPDGNINHDSIVDILDVMLALKVAVGQPVTYNLLHGDVAPLSGGKPLPDGIIDGRDVLVILGRTVGNYNTW